MNKKNRVVLIAFVDLVIVSQALFLSYLLRFEFAIPAQYIEQCFNWTPAFIFSQFAVFYVMGLYARIWRYTSLIDMYAIISAVAVSCCMSFLFVFFTMGAAGYPRSVLVLYLIFNILLTAFSRLSVRIYYSHYKSAEIDPVQNKKKRKSLILVGAGRTGDKIAREILTTSNNDYTLKGFIDDDPQKHGALLHGKKIFGGIKELPNLKIKYDEILITAPTATGDQMRRIVEMCKQTNKRYKTVPTFSELISGELSLDNIRDVSYADLLGRLEVKLDMLSIDKLLQGKRILITGAGGSIGNELLKQCLNFDPAEIICLDISEEKIYNLGQFSEKLHSKTIIKTVMATINNWKELKRVFVEMRPQIVFHAAACKHVPLQELHPWMAVKTNIGGTLNLIKLSEKYSVDKFVLVSTDKAVNPVNIMGATKRAAEILIQSFNKISNTCFMAVRFGNVLGSSGSAIPTFQKQINEGGPITITHPEMTRYFMSIQEASQLILQCGALGKDGEIFLLEMGKPIKILQMAKDLIRLSGLDPDTDIPIVYTGLRPGEKLYEELQFFNEKKMPTNHEKIMILKESKPHSEWEIFEQGTNTLLAAADDLDAEKIQSFLIQFLPSYRPRNFDVNIEKRSVQFSIKGQA